MAMPLAGGSAPSELAGRPQNREDAAGPEVDVPVRRFGPQCVDAVVGPDTDPRDRQRPERLRPFREREGMGEACSSRGAADLFVVPAFGVGEQSNRMADNVFKDVPAAPKVPLAFVLTECREVAVGIAVRSEGDSGLQ